ncbi:aliphatic sulfonate ABC transporter substrate-binding protein [uncultured Rhodoblastus sp.]|uniref:aliphatic sulfonate ABC transporter substrate-binding protein n=1 Tax=uncultured Rhodoblastus sp. TaxID=543037 RepID=UPI0025F8F73D|nr:aliphatic sulfonate ABC transporter substrate-binding protein [uncultured Rhodoblastus sp.]
MTRRLFLVSVAGAMAVASGGGAFAVTPVTPVTPAAPVKQIRVGYQKTSALLVTKALGLLEKRFASEGVAVSWHDFQAGPPLLEALNAGAIDYGYTGDSPPIFAQAARAKLLYVAAIPARGEGQGIVVQANSPIRTVADLKGRKVGVAKGSSGHNLLIASLESAHVEWDEISAIYLSPADASAALANGAIDAWSIWDPFYAIAEIGIKARSLPVDRNATRQNSFFLANRDFTAKYPETVAAINAEVSKATDWAAAHRDETAKLFAEASGVDFVAQKRSVDRAEYTFSPLTPAVLDLQQQVADRYFKLKLIPNRIDVREIVWEKARA